MNPHLLFGLVTHSASEVYDKAKVEKKSHDDGVRLAVRHALEKTGKRSDAIICQDCTFVEEVDVRLRKTIIKGNICRACNSDNTKHDQQYFFPWISDHKNKNRYTLIRTIVWYLDHYKDSEEKTVVLADGSPAVELWLRFGIDTKTAAGESYTLSCHLDKLVQIGEGYWFKDIKTTKNTIDNRFFEKFSPDNQMSFYTLGSQIVFRKPILGGIIDGAQVAIHFSRFQRGMVQRTKAQLDEWLFDLKVLLRQAEVFAKEGHWPMNDTSCHQYGGCDFLGICNKDPAVRETFLRTHFTKRVWDPTKERK